MSESFEQQKSLFIFPDIKGERGEFERVSDLLTIDTQTLMDAAASGELTSLHEELWQQLDNTDSNRFTAGEWQYVQEYSEEQDVQRDWEHLRKRVEKKQPLDAPIVLKHNEIYHLVSGNTRLMVARAAGITPDILLFQTGDISE